MSKPKATPTNIRLKDLKAPLQKEAFRLDKSLNWIVCKALTEYVKTLKK